MKIPHHISQRGESGIYQVRRRVPSDVIEVIGRREFKQSLKTGDLKVATRLARDVLSEWDRICDQARMGNDLTVGDLPALAKEYYDRSLLRDDTARAYALPRSEIEGQQEEAKRLLSNSAMNGEFSDEDQFETFAKSLDYPVLFESTEWNAAELDIRLSELRKCLANGETFLVAHAADDSLLRNKLTLSKTDPMYRKLCFALLRAEIEHLTRIRERDDGDYTGEPCDSILKESVRVPFSRATFAEIIEEQLLRSERGLGGRLAPSTMQKYRTVIGQFVKWRESDRLATVTKAEVEAWRDELINDRYNTKTVRDKISTIRTVAEWGQRQTDGQMFEKRHPLDALELPRIEKSNSANKTYTLEQARTVLTEARKQGQPHRRWLPWLLAYSGARIAEITQLEKADFFQYEEMWFYHIRVGEGRTTKSNLSRKVPVHPALIDEGLLDFVSSLPDGRLFTSNKAAQNTRQWINKEVMSNYPHPRPAPFHGFRHLFEDLIRRAQIDTVTARQITGRTVPGSAESYGKSDIVLPALATQMEKIPSFLPPPKLNHGL